MYGFASRPVRPNIDPPAGRIKTRGELLDLIIEARKEKKAIRLYLVEQSGHLGEFFITSQSRLSKPKYETGLASGPNFYSVNGRKLAYWERDAAPKRRYYSYEILTGSYNIEVDGSSDHYAFTNRALAERYSNFLKNDAAYMRYVREWHAYCDKVFR
jgi:hypothetical protein